ncbi:hypothetical protein JHN49_21505 [Streptomyces sp. MBT57]|nr:hypothetical protein [Streptomyces sp. MBT57]
MAKPGRHAAESVSTAFLLNQPNPGETTMKLTEGSREDFPLAEDSFYSKLHSSAALAALYAGILAIPAPFEQWTGLSTGGATAINEGKFLIFEPNPMRIIAMKKCRQNQWHTMLVLHGRTLAELADAVNDCTDHNPRLQETLYPCKGLVRRKSSINETRNIPTNQPSQDPRP